MVSGRVNGRREAVLSLRLRGPIGSPVIVEAIVDTGFTGSMTVPASVVATLGSVRQLARKAKLGDGTVREFGLYAADVEWNGSWRPILVYETGREALVGTRLLEGHRVTVDVVPGGAVRVEPIAP